MNLNDRATVTVPAADHVWVPNLASDAPMAFGSCCDLPRHRHPDIPRHKVEPTSLTRGMKRGDWTWTSWHCAVCGSSIHRVAGRAGKPDHWRH